jgi:hypothetical protein
MRFRGGVAVALGLVLGTAGSSFAVPGVLDPRFSNDGKVLVNFGAEPRDEIAHDVLVTGSGKIVLAGSIGRPAASSWALARLRPTAGSTKRSAATARSGRRWARWARPG